MAERFAVVQPLDVDAEFARRVTVDAFDLLAQRVAPLGAARQLSGGEQQQAKAQRAATQGKTVHR